MVTALVVDDEQIVCQGIKEFLEQANLGITQVITASNGFEALDYLRIEPLDIILTDIQMDGMNGIELMETILAERSDVPIVVISAYDEFDYAQRCLRLGARDYLIKPVSPQQLNQVVGRVLADRNEKYKARLEEALKRKYSLKEMSSLRTFLLNDLITEPAYRTDDYQYIFDHIGLALTGPYYSVLVLDLLFDRTEERGGEPILTLKDRNLFKFAAHNIVEESLAEWDAVSFYGQGRRLVVIFQLDRPEAQQMNVIGKLLIQNIAKYLHLRAVVGISPSLQGLHTLPESYGRADETVKWREVYPDHDVFYFEDFIKKDMRGGTNWQEEIDAFIEWARMGRSEEESARKVAEFSGKLSAGLIGLENRNGILLSIAYRVYSLLLDGSRADDERVVRLNPFTYFLLPLTDYQMHGRFVAFLREAVDLIRSSLEDYDQAIVQQAAAYLRRYFRNKGLKLQDVADEVHLSSNYLSYLFKRLLGVTIWEHVTDLRMAEARRLLLHTDKKRYEIADEVGYESPEHFSRLFKRYYGESPNQVRSRGE